MAPSCKIELVRFSARLRIQDEAECGNINSDLPFLDLPLCTSHGNKLWYQKYFLVVSGCPESLAQQLSPWFCRVQGMLLGIPSSIHVTQSWISCEVDFLGTLGFLFNQNLKIFYLGGPAPYHTTKLLILQIHRASLSTTMWVKQSFYQFSICKLISSTLKL